LTALLAIRYGIPTVFAVLLAVAITVVVGLVVAIPALRTRGATLAVATVSLLVVIEDLLLTNPNAAQLLGQNSIKPMTIFGLNVSPLTDPRAYGVLVLIVFLALGLAVLNVRRSATGRRLLAIRANPNAAASLGISPAAVKMYAFALSSAIAAICGSLTEVRFSYPDFTLFNTDSSITQVLQGSIGGVGWISGALVGALAVSSGILDRIISVIASPSNWIDIVTAAGVFLVLLQSPDGIVPVSTDQLKRAYWHLRARIVPSQHVAGAMRPQAEDPFRQALREGYVAADRRSPALVEIECLSVEFGSVKALDGVSLTVAPGEIVGLIGPNGAGKSTLIDAVCGVLRPTSGEIRLDGESLIGLSPTGRARRGVIRSFQSLELFEDMTVSENLLVASQFPRWWHGITDLIWPARPRPTESARQAAQEFRLEPYFGSTPRMLDHGHRRLLAIARTFAADPAVVMLDEPAAGLDSRQRQELGVLLKKVAKEWNIGVLLVEHDVNLVFRMCDRVVALVNGCVVAQGSPDQVRENPQVVEAYLGTGVRRASPILGGRSDWTPSQLSQLSKTGETALRSWVPT
jgi:sulfate-transporting ATPase